MEANGTVMAANGSQSKPEPKRIWAKDMVLGGKYHLFWNSLDDGVHKSRCGVWGNKNWIVAARARKERQEKVLRKDCCLRCLKSPTITIKFGP